MARFPAAVLAFPVLALIASGKAKRMRIVSRFLLGFAAALLLQGVLDYVTWGGFFSSPISFFILNLVNPHSSVISPWHFYFTSLPFVYSGVLYLALIGFEDDYRSHALWLSVLVFLGLIATPLDK